MQRLVIKKETTTLPLKKIKPNKDQPRKRFDEAELTELSDSIKQNGILQPLLVREKGDHYEIVAGERRFQAAKLAKLEEVPVVIKAISDEEVFKLALIENLQRSDLSPIEEAQGYKQLIKQENLTPRRFGQGPLKNQDLQSQIPYVFLTFQQRYRL